MSEVNDLRVLKPRSKPLFTCKLLNRGITEFRESLFSRRKGHMIIPHRIAHVSGCNQLLGSDQRDGIIEKIIQVTLSQFRARMT